MELLSQRKNNRNSPYAVCVLTHKYLPTVKQKCNKTSADSGLTALSVAFKNELRVLIKLSKVNTEDSFYVLERA